ncbi:MAG: hypothetical protein ACREMY_20520 [bacterium]
MPAWLSLLFFGAALALTTATVRSGGPDDPGAPTRADRYRPVTSGTKSYRPVEPLPWGDVNRRVTPAPKKKVEPEGSGAAPGPEHKH